MLSGITRTFALAALAAGLGASALSDVAEARGGRGFGGGHRGGGFRHGGGSGHHSPRHFGGHHGRRVQNHSHSQGFRRPGIGSHGHSDRHGVRHGHGRTRIGNGSRIASRGRHNAGRRWRDRFRHGRHGRWGIGRRHWRHWYFGFGFAMSGDNYMNPYCGAEGGDEGGEGGEGGGCYDYNQPVTGDSQPTDEGVNFISQADAAFQKGEYETALSLTEKAIKQMPNNADLHQFRSLALFALKRYREAAVASHAALVGGKGWNWETLRGFYPSKEVYTSQLRELESHVSKNPKDAAGQFLLGYHYMMMGHGDAAGSQMATVVKLEPRDKLAAKMLAGISQKTGKQYAAQVASAAGKAMNPTPAGTDASTPPKDEEPLQSGSAAASQAPAKPADFNIVGNWKSQDDGSVITLTFAKDGKFKWVAKEGTNSFTIDGTYILTNGSLKLNSPKEKQPLEGTLTVKGNNQFELKLKDAEKDEAPLTFKRQ